MRSGRGTSLACWWAVLLLAGCASATETSLTDAKGDDGPEDDAVAAGDVTGASPDVTADEDGSEQPTLLDGGSEEDGQPGPQPADVEISPEETDGGVVVDAGSSTDEPDAPPPIPCVEDNPAGCAQTGCPDDMECSLEDGCAPLACYCADAGKWVCSQDCAGGVCVATNDKPGFGTTKCGTPNPTACSVVDCPPGMLCDEEAGCAPSNCECTALGIWICTADCVPGICVDKGTEPGPGLGTICPKPSPATCAETGCPGTMVCDEEAGCGPSDCSCDPGAGEWVCTEDCVPGICVPKSDGGGDPGGPTIPLECPESEVPTTKGCQTCEEVMDHIIAMMPSVEGGADKCLENSECVLTDGGTACMGTCPVSVNGAWEDVYLAKKQDLSDAFCTGYAEECGYMTPGCLPVEPQCIDGICEAVASPE